jgi:hypothetical protein
MRKDRLLRVQEFGKGVCGLQVLRVGYTVRNLQISDLNPPPPLSLEKIFSKLGSRLSAAKLP